MNSEWLESLLSEVTNSEGLYFEKQASEENGKKVKKYLKETYPEETLKWVKDAYWEKGKVPLKEIQMGRRPGGAREVDKVKNIAKAYKEGKINEPVVLVRTPDGKTKIADGYHRTLGCKHAGRKEIDAWVGVVSEEKGPWDKEMHEKKLNKGSMKKEAAVPLLATAGRVGLSAGRAGWKGLKAGGRLAGRAGSAVSKGLNNDKVQKAGNYASLALIGGEGIGAASRALNKNKVGEKDKVEGIDKIEEIEKKN